MCLTCHDNMSDETVKGQLLHSLENPQFEVWNSTSINHLVISLCGFNGYEVSDLAHTLLKRYIAWAKETGQNVNGDTEEKINTIAFRINQMKEEGITSDVLKHNVREAFNSTFQ